MEAIENKMSPPYNALAWDEVRNIIQDSTDDETLRIALEEFYDKNMLQSEGYFYVKRGTLKKCLHLLENNKNGIIALKRLEGTTLKELSEEYGISSEAIRQKVKRVIKNSIPYVMEDYYTCIFNAFDLK